MQNKVAIVTGAGTGIGYAIAERLLSQGVHVVLNDIDDEQGERSLQALGENSKGKCLFFGGDAGSMKVIDALVEFTLSNFNRIDFVIPNAGMTLFGDFFEFTEENFQRVVNLNLQGAFFLVQKTVPLMKAQNEGGRIVLMSSITGIKSYPNLTAYSMTKAALRMMARNLVLALAPHEITINVIAPGATLTERTELEEPDYAGAWAKLVPRGVVGKPIDIANTCLFLLSKEAAHINGQTVVVDGGWTVVGRYPGDLD